MTKNLSNCLISQIVFGDRPSGLIGTLWYKAMSNDVRLFLQTDTSENIEQGATALR